MPFEAWKLQIFATPDGYEALIVDAEKKLRRAYQWHGFDGAPAAGECDAKRTAAGLAAYKENIRAETIRLYLAELEQQQPAPVLEMEEEF